MNRLSLVCRPGKCGLVAGALVAWALAAAPARADKIDQSLMKDAAPNVMEHLRKQGYKNVAVLNFRVELPKAKPSFHVGRLNSLMATRLENVLILANDDEKPLGITRGASAVAAARDKKATYLTAEGRKNLFAQKYPLAWGDQEVKVDALLTGVVRLSADLKTAYVVIEEWSPGRETPAVPATFQTPTDRLLLADLDRGFFLGRRSLEDALKVDEVDGAAVDSARKDNGAGLKGDTFEDVLDFRAYYDGKEVKAGPDNKLPSPREGQEVYFTLRARKERLGVVLLVNGMNTLGEEGVDREPDQYSMWVLYPGKVCILRGYYTVENPRDAAGKDRRKSAVRKFRVLSDSESGLAELGDSSKVGKVELLIYREPRGELPRVARRAVNMRSVTARGASFEEVKGQILRLGAAKRGRNLIAPPDPKATGTTTIQTVEFNGVLTGSRTITYFEGPR
jgi:hypothetical protein